MSNAPKYWGHLPTDPLQLWQSSATQLAILVQDREAQLMAKIRELEVATDANDILRASLVAVSKQRDEMEKGRDKLKRQRDYVDHQLAMREADFGKKPVDMVIQEWAAKVDHQLDRLELWTAQFQGHGMAVKHGDPLERVIFKDVKPLESFK